MDQSLWANDVGENLRALRKGRRLTLAAASRLCGLPLSTLSKVETGRTSLSFAKLLQIADGLGVDIGEIIANRGEKPAGARVTARRSITRASAGRFIETPIQLYEYLGTDLRAKQMTPMIITVKAQSMAEIGALTSHPGEEFMLVLDGRVEFFSEFYEPVVLDRGDSIYFDSTMGHAVTAVGRGDAVILDVCTGRPGPSLSCDQGTASE